jgi:hypothetical protein
MRPLLNKHGIVYLRNKNGIKKRIKIFYGAIFILYHKTMVK